MTAYESKETAQAYFYRVLNRGDMVAADRIFDRDIAFHYPLGDLTGCDAVKSYIEAVRTAFPDIQFTVAALAIDGGYVAARWSLTGTQSGEFKGKPPSGKRVSPPGITWLDLESGRIREMWVSFDPARLIG